MRTIFNAVFVAAILIFASSCIKEKQLDGSITGKTDNAEVILRLKTPGGFSASGSRALTNAQENTINDIYVLVFDKTNTLVAIKQGEEVTYTVGDSNPLYSGSGSFSVTLEASRTDLDTYNLVVLANAATILSGTIGLDVSAISDKSYSAVTARIWAGITGAMYASGGTIPMWGESGQTVIEPGSANQTLTLTRSVARIDVGVGRVSFDGTSDYSWDGKDAGGATIPFELTDVYVIRPNDRYAVIPNTALAAGTPTVPAGTTAFSVEDSEDDFAFTAAGGFTSRDIYVPEADILMGTIGKPGDAKHTERMAVVVGGKYNNGSKTYYRLDFAKHGGLMNVLRNHLYQFNISGVSGAGYPDVETAYKSLAMNMTVEILEWNETEIGEIVFDGQYMLGIRPSSEFEFFKTTETQTASIKTTHPDGWKVLKITEADGVTPPSNGWLTTDKNTGTLYGSDRNYTSLGITVSDNTSNNDRTGYIYLKAGKLETRLTVTQGINSKKVPVFYFIEYVNVDGTDNFVPPTGGRIQAKVHTNVAWALKTSINGVESSMSEPASEIATDHTLSVDIPSTGDVWTSTSTQIWIEYNDLKFQETTFISPGYNIVFLDAPTNISKQGGSITLNLSGYFPAMNFRVIDDSDAIVSNIKACLATGSISAGGNSSVTITVHANSSYIARNITFQYEKSPNTWVNIETASQSGYLAPTRGVIAPPGILGVGTTTGKLTLNGSKEYPDGTAGETVYMVYFKWGSTIAIGDGGSTANDAYDKTDIAWVPSEFTGTITDAWGSVPCQSSGAFPAQNNAAGLGDPCSLAEKDGYKGGYKMPSGTTWFETINSTPGTWIANYSGVSGRWNTAGTRFYPTTGYRYNTGQLTAFDSANGYYWMATVHSNPTDAYSMSVQSGGVFILNNNRTFGFPVRCIEK